MQLVERHIITSTNKYYKELDEATFKSKNLYNSTLYAIRQHFFQSEKYLSYATLQKQFQDSKQPDYIALPTKVSQQVMKQVDTNFRAFFKALKAYKSNPSKFNGRPKLPKYKHKTDGRFVLIYTNQAISKKECDRDSVIHPSGLEFKFKTKISYQDINQVRIVPKCNYFVVEVIYTISDCNLLSDNKRYAAIDLGINNLATLTSNIIGDTPMVISGKVVKSYNQYYNKQVAHYKSILELQNNTKTSRRIRRLHLKRKFKIEDYMHKASRYIVNQLVSKGINTLIIGKNDGWKQDINIGKVNNQKFVQIPFESLLSKLQYKCSLVGINVELINESYTSKCSFLDGETIEKHEEYVGKRIHRGLFRSAQGTLINADVNGSYNILRKSKPKAFADGVEGVVVHPVIIPITH